MDNLNVERDIRSIKRMVAWITAIVIIGALCLVMGAVGFYIQGQRQQAENTVMYCVQNPGVC